MKRHFHKLSGLNHKLFIGLAIFFAVVALFSLRANNLQAVKLRNNVTAVDQANGDVEKALQDLRLYIYSHMNTSLSSGGSVYPPIQLKHRYERLVTAEKERFEQQTATVYQDAQKFCEQQNSTDVSGRNRIPCIEQYVTSNVVTPQQPIADDLYKFDFASPAWSPDLAGFSLLFAGIFAFIGTLSYLTALWLKGRLL